MFNWDAFLVRLQSYPVHYHRILPACSESRIKEVEKELGTLPANLKEMVRRFNGAKLFLSGIPLIRLFRISTNPPLPSLDWAPEWCIDTFTKKWRAAGSDREDDWALAMMNYGGLVLLDGDDTVKEWDTSEGRWLIEKLPLDRWIDKIFEDGEAVMAI